MQGGQSGGEGKPSQQSQESGKKKDQSESEPKEGEDGKKPGQKQDKPQGDKPDGNQQSTPNPQDNQQGTAPEQPVQDQAGSDPAVNVWGNLPIHLRDIFRAEGGVDVPAQYRDWIDSYYRRLNRRGK